MHNSNLAYKQSRSPKGQKHDINHIIEKRVTKQQKLYYLKIVALMLFFILASISLLARNVQVTEESGKLTNLKKEYTDLYSANKKKEVEINKKIDLKTVEEIAVSSYGMNRAKKDQIVYVNIKGQDYGVVATDVTKANTDKAQDKNINILTGLLAYFDN